MPFRDTTADAIRRMRTREQRVRRAARRQGYTLSKSSRRDPRALDYGRYWLLRHELEAVPFGDRFKGYTGGAFNAGVPITHPGGFKLHGGLSIDPAWVGLPGGFTLDQTEAFLRHDTSDPVVTAELARVRADRAATHEPALWTEVTPEKVRSK